MGLVIKLVGVGGIINQMLPQLLTAYPGARFQLYDGDIYKKRNLERQGFAVLGSNKALATAAALQKEGFEVKGYPHYITPDNCSELITEGDLILAGVDNFKSRLLLNNRCLELRDVLLISGGNDLKDGSAQVMWRKNGIALTPPLTYCHPEIEFPRDKAPFEKGCLELWPSQPQLAETNLAVGQVMLEALADALVGKPIVEIYVSIESELTTRKVLPQERGWIAA